ncbi:MAG: sigma 54-interacting transcriptional regulator [Acidobacteria bacterium]|nr:sigma 54-interacting transcriptional regulator [Acidobacteriota bacterium]
MSARLLSLYGPLAGQAIPLPDVETIVGRDPDAGIVLEGQGVAWRHCVFVGRRLTDLRSAEGTLVNGLRIREDDLNPGDHISIGPHRFVFEPDTAGRAPALLEACTMIFLFRALLAGPNPIIEQHLAQLLGCAAIRFTLGPGPEDVSVDHRERIATVPVFARGERIGALRLDYPGPTPDDDTLGALATLATVALESQLHLNSLKSENAVLRERLSGIIGQSPNWLRVLNLALRAAPSEATVLILGETGTGKEVIAQAIHRASNRAKGPFLALNCAVFGESLLESELFGHEKGAFTGAIERKPGKLETAAGGTVFLDEVGELAPQLQAKFLRVLQQREFERIGGRQTIKLDARILAATNRELSAEVKAGRFREDLYHRLNVVTLHTPPLRERKLDIPALASHFLARATRPIDGISPAAMRLLTAYDWPGNVRELQNCLERASVLGSTRFIEPDDLPEELNEPPKPAAGFSQAKGTAIVEAWTRAKGDYKQAAALLGIHPNSLLRMIRRLGLRPQLP